MTGDPAATSNGDNFSGREAVRELRDRARRLFENGAGGLQIASAISEGVDRLVLDLVDFCLNGFAEDVRERLRRHGAVVAVGGTGRGEMCPFSDVDLLFLYEGSERDDFLGLAALVVRECWDAGIQLGHAVRTVPETLAIAARESDVATALVEARTLWGSERLVDLLRERFRRRVARNPRAFIESCVARRNEERSKYGGTVRQLAPNVKCSPGGLRDVHLVRWITFARFGTPDLDAIHLNGALLKRDVRELQEANDFLLLVRHDLHLDAEREDDLLTRDDQLRITNRRHVRGTDGQIPVERFMQDYLQHACTIEDVCDRYVALQRSPGVGERFVRSLFSHRVDGVYRVGPEHVDIVPRHRETICNDLERVMEMYRLAALSGVVPTPIVVETIARARLQPPRELTERMARTFLEILRCRTELGPILRSMYATGILDCMIPDLTRTRGLLQFNQYHSFTVDEHTLRVVEAATGFAEDDGALGGCHAGVQRIEFLHLALLLHDLGKGFPEDHSDVGGEIARRIARRLYLSDDDSDLLVFLVHRHLLMTHLAFRRDLTDPGVIIEFAQQVGSAETLRLLYLLSAADLQGVGPGTWTSWKADLLRELYQGAMLYLSGKRSHFDEADRLERTRDRVLDRLTELGEKHLEPYRELLRSLPPHYLLSLSTIDVANDLRLVVGLGDGQVAVHGVYEADSDTVEYRIVAKPRSSAGFFQRLAGTFAAKGMGVLAAWIATTDLGVVIDRFDVTDEHHVGPVPDWRIAEVCDALRRALDPATDVESLLRRKTRFDISDSAELSLQRTKVSVDNESSDRCTVIDVFAFDRPGLLYTVGRTLHELGLSVELAKISTHLDQVVDVFYVTDREHGGKIRDAERLTVVRETLYDEITEFESEGYRRFQSTSETSNS